MNYILILIKVITLKYNPRKPSEPLPVSEAVKPTQDDDTGNEEKEKTEDKKKGDTKHKAKSITQNVA